MDRKSTNDASHDRRTVILGKELWTATFRWPDNSNEFWHAHEVYVTLAYIIAVCSGSILFLSYDGGPSVGVQTECFIVLLETAANFVLSRSERCSVAISSIPHRYHSRNSNAHYYYLVLNYNQIARYTENESSQKPIASRTIYRTPRTKPN